MTTLQIVSPLSLTFIHLIQLNSSISTLTVQYFSSSSHFSISLATNLFFSLKGSAIEDGICS